MIIIQLFVSGSGRRKFRGPWPVVCDAAWLSLAATRLEGAYRRNECAANAVESKPAMIKSRAQCLRSNPVTW